MATRAKFAWLAQYLRKFSEASHIFLKNGLWQMSASLASPCKTGWRMLASLASPRNTALQMSTSLVSPSKTSWRMSASLASPNIFQFLGFLYSPDLLNLPNLPNSRHYSKIQKCRDLCSINCNLFVVVSSNQIRHLSSVFHKL